MIDVADQCAFTCTQQIFESLFTFGERLLPQIALLTEHEIKGEEDQILSFAVGQRSLECGEVRRTLFIECGDFAIDDAVGELARCGCDLRKLVRPIETFACAQFAMTLEHAHLNSITIELHFMRPRVADRWTIEKFAKLRLDE